MVILQHAILEHTSPFYLDVSEPIPSIGDPLQHPLGAAFGAAVPRRAAERRGVGEAEARHVRALPVQQVLDGRDLHARELPVRKCSGT